MVQEKDPGKCLNNAYQARERGPWRCPDSAWAVQETVLCRNSGVDTERGTLRDTWAGGSAKQSVEIHTASERRVGGIEVVVKRHLDDT